MFLKLKHFLCVYCRSIYIKIIIAGATNSFVFVHLEVLYVLSVTCRTTPFSKVCNWGSILYKINSDFCLIKKNAFVLLNCRFCNIVTEISP